MGNMNLVTGYRGANHVTADDHGSLYAGIFGEGSCVLNRGSKFAASAVSANKINIADGDLIIQGRHGRIAPGSTVSVTLSNGSQGYKRHDLIVARYSRNASTSVEDLSLVVIKGTQTTGTPADPDYTSGDILVSKNATADFPLYRVVLNGVNIEEIEQLFSVFIPATLGADGKLSVGSIPALGYIPTSQKGAANGVAPLDASTKVPIARLPVSSQPNNNSAATIPNSAALYKVYNTANQALEKANAAEDRGVLWLTVDVSEGYIEEDGFYKIHGAYTVEGNYDIRLRDENGRAIYYFEGAGEYDENDAYYFFSHNARLVVTAHDDVVLE